MEDKKISTESYKGVRDFYPEDMAVQNYIFNTWRKVAEKFGYVEYGASILEPAELYLHKTSDEIVNRQMFTFKDRGDREVALRPEMTPTLARMVAARRRGLKLPLRWFSIPNVFRYEQPQRGRKREHWQLNCDLLGIADTSAEVEIISLAHAVMKEFGAKDEDFEIRVNHRGYFPYLFKSAGINISNEQLQKMMRLFDQRDKMNDTDFALESEKIIGKENMVLFTSKESEFDKYAQEFNAENRITELGEILKNKGIENIKSDPSIARGFDYYTGIVFEIFDTSPDNRRSLLGGGRYDNLLEIFNVDPIPTVGFGMGDVTMRDFLETHNLRTS